MPENMWRSWSEWGRRKAAERIGIPVQSVIPTTNHLESFNCIIKRKFIRSWLRSGNRLRVDFLILILVVCSLLLDFGLYQCTATRRSRPHLLRFFTLTVVGPQVYRALSTQNPLADGRGTLGSASDP